jgi:hypothetical protein
VEFFALHTSTLAFILDRSEGLRKMAALGCTKLNVNALLAT